MKSAATVHLGFEVGTGAPVALPLKHMAVTGQSQEAGKTTALEALLARADVRAVTFITKRGEGSFTDGRRLAPFFRERADWVFVASLIDATLGEKNKLLRAWLMKVCRNTATLAEVQRNVRAAKASARGFAESIYTEIEGYLELVVPQLAQLPPARGVTIGPGLNVMDLSPYSSELQALVIRSVLEHVYEHERDVVTVIPEAWEFLPEHRGSPVKLAAETLIRKGAALRNYMWIDSQDLAGVWKLAVRACPIVLIGVQREANEIKRTLANIPAGVAKPSAADIAQLELGQFYACWGRHAIKTYVQPAWMDEDRARTVATGRVTVDQVARQQQSIARDAARIARRFMGRTSRPQEDEVNVEDAKRLEKENGELRTDLARAHQTIADLERRLQALEGGGGDRRPAPVPRTDRRDAPEQPRREAARSASAAAARELTAPPFIVEGDGRVDAEALYRAFKARLIDEAPGVLAQLQLTVPEIDVAVTREVVKIDGTTLFGRLAQLISEGWFDDPKGGTSTWNELQRRGFTGANNVGRELARLAEKGFLTKEEGGYQAVAGMKVRVVEA